MSSSTPYTPFAPSGPAPRPNPASRSVPPPPAAERGLNPAQQEAVHTLKGPLLVLAGAGTGKTRVITHRMAELIRRGVPANQILSVTFTNKAAREMQERMRALLGKQPAVRPTLSTFHALCVQILRREIEALGYPRNFVIYDRGDQEAAARRALRDVRITDAALRPGDLLAQISRWKMNGIRPDLAKESSEDDRGFLAAVAYRRYQANLQATGAVDFDDLLLLTAVLFAEHPDVLAREQARFSHVQIDEYQDTNQMQFEIVSALVRPHRNLCVVGDDDQSIYGWRGAEVKHILGFQTHFPEAKVIRLQENYRCTSQIIAHANQLIQNNRGRHEKELVAHKTGATDVVIRDLPDEQTEAEWVSREINYLLQELHVPPTEIAVLFRTNEQPRAFESEFRRLKIPYDLVGGQSFFDRKEVRDILAYLKVLAQPHDEVSLLRIINVPPRGIGETSMQKLLGRAVRQGERIWDAIPGALEEKLLTVKTANNLNRFQSLLQQFRERFTTPGGRLSESLKALLTAIDYEQEITQTYKEVQQQLNRHAVLDEIFEAVEEYEQRARKPTLEGFLEETSLNPSDREYEPNEDQKPAAVKLMTLHAAKGLEFPRVYLVGLEEGLLPHQRSVDAEKAGDANAIEEERRLAYVGVTRAKDVLTITWSKTRMKYAKRRQTTPSRFLREMCERETDAPAAGVPLSAEPTADE